jgi:hypothetical protein
MRKQIALLVLLFGCVAAYGVYTENYEKWAGGSMSLGESTYATDVDGDGETELLVVGTAASGFDNAFLNISSWNGSAMVAENYDMWYHGSTTETHSVYAADVDLDGTKEILIVGYNNDGVDATSFLNISTWNATAANFEYFGKGYVGDARSVFAADVDNDGTVEILITGRNMTSAFLNISNWNGAALTTEHYETWKPWGWTRGNSIYAADVDNDGVTEILTAGEADDGGGTYWAFLNITRWSGAAATTEAYGMWREEGTTFTRSVYAADVDGDGYKEILQVGQAFDGAKYTAFINITQWNGAALTTEYYTRWYDTGGTEAHSVFAADVDNDGIIEILTTGTFYDGAFNQYTFLNITRWNGTAATLEKYITWRDGGTSGESLYAGDVDDDGAAEIVMVGTSNADVSYRTFLNMSQPRFLATAVPSGLAFRLFDGTNISAVAQPAGNRSFFIYNGTGLVAAVDMNFSDDDVSFAGLIAANDTAANKALLHMTAWPSQIGLDKRLYVPGTGTGWVRLCPNATAFAEITSTCPNGVNQTASFNGTHYTLHSNGSGGMEIPAPDNAPTVSLNAPAPGATSTSLTVQFNFTPVDDSGFSNCSLWLNSTGSWAYNASNQSAISNNSVNTINKTFVANGVYTWNVQCCDNAAQCAFDAGNRTLTVNVAAPPVDNPPTVTLTAPTDGANSSSHNVEFKFEPADDWGFSNCSLWTNASGSWTFDTLNQSSIGNNSVNTITKSFASNGAYLWNVQCCDNASQCAFAAGNRTVNIRHHEGDGIGIMTSAPEDPFAIAAILCLALASFAAMAWRRR